MARTLKEKNFQFLEYSEHREKEMERFWLFLRQIQEVQQKEEQEALKDLYLKRPHIDLVTNPEYQAALSELRIEQQDAKLLLGQYLFKIRETMEITLRLQKMNLESQHK
jgi:hypothetical protein|eukprot:Tamp_01467.p5 GENE.Tamp_01467~~Tamp_01467.p5  ORF type:complete len:109 (+),score=15.40 Tamp_01467:3740-4066(+)